MERAWEASAGGEGEGGKQNARKPRGFREKVGSDDRARGRKEAENMQKKERGRINDFRERA